MFIWRWWISSKLRLKVESKVLTYLSLIEEFATDIVFQDILNDYFFCELGLFFIVQLEVKKCLLTNGYAVGSRDGKCNATAWDIVDLHLATTMAWHTNKGVHTHYIGWFSVMFSEVQSHQKSTSTSATGFQGVPAATEFTHCNIFHKGALRTPDRGSIICFHKRFLYLHSVLLVAQHRQLPQLQGQKKLPTSSSLRGHFYRTLFSILASYEIFSIGKMPIFQGVLLHLCVNVLKVHVKETTGSCY